jgi:hypothetical protein
MVHWRKSGDEGVAVTAKRRGVASTPIPTESFRLRQPLPLGPAARQRRPT